MTKPYKYLDAYIDEQRANGKYRFTTKGVHVNKLKK